MNEINPQYRFGISIGVSHYLQIGLGKSPIFREEEVGSEWFGHVVDQEAESAIARRILELARIEPPVLVIPDVGTNFLQYQSFGPSSGDYIQKFVDVARVDGPLNAPELVGVSDYNDHFYALNRVDKLRSES